jgi:hypothetical protein
MMTGQGGGMCISFFFFMGKAKILGVFLAGFYCVSFPLPLSFSCFDC